MSHDEFKDRLFDLLNDTDSLPIADIEVDDLHDQIKVVLQDGSEFLLTTAFYGKRYIIK